MGKVYRYSIVYTMQLLSCVARWKFKFHPVAGVPRNATGTLVEMPDVQNFFHEALAVIITKLQYLYTRRKLSVSSNERYHFPVERSMCE